MDATIVPEFNSWLEELVSSDGSDLHVKVGSPPMMRLTHGLVRLDRDPLSPIETQAIADGVIPEDRKTLFKERGEVDFAYSVANVGRFRANVSCVRIDDFRAASEMTAHLISLGHSRIGFIKGHPNQTASAQRFAGFETTLESHGIAPNPAER